MSSVALLQYPDKFRAAAFYVSSLEEGDSKALSDETRLALYALYQQTTVGPCKEPKPWSWNVVTNAKWQYWRELGDLPALEAMRLYVRTLEEDAPDWHKNVEWVAEGSGEDGTAVADGPASEALAGAASAGRAVAKAPAGGDDAPSAATGAAPAAAAHGSGEDPAAPDTPSSPASKGGLKATAADEAAVSATVAEAPAAPASAGPPTEDQSPNASATPSKRAQPTRSVAEVVVEGSWVSPYVGPAPRPPARYDHAAALLGTRLVVVGGTCKGRALGDAWTLGLEDLRWRQVPGGPGAPPPAAGAAAVAWGEDLLLLGGLSRDSGPELSIRRLDSRTLTWLEVDAQGPRPGARAGHSATRLGDRVVVFGGEDPGRRALGDAHVLDLGSMTWSPLLPGTGEDVRAPEAPFPRPWPASRPPAPRSAHVATALDARTLLVHGGGSVARVYGDMFALDVLTGRWHQPLISGQAPTPRAGHAAATLGGCWYLAGGGDNAAGCADMYALDLAAAQDDPEAPLEWTLLGHTPPESAIASEGSSLTSVPLAGCLIAFGGYNGRYHNTVHVYRPEGYVVVKSPFAKGNGGEADAAAAAFGSESSPAATGAPGAPPPPPPPAAASSPDARGRSPTRDATRASASASTSPARHSRHASDLEAVRQEAALNKESASLELALLRRQLASAQAAAGDAEEVANRTKVSLQEEQARAIGLEAELEALRGELAAAKEGQKELARLRGEVDGDEAPAGSAGAEAPGEDALEQPPPKRGGGLWGFISGADSAA